MIETKTKQTMTEGGGDRHDISTLCRQIQSYVAVLQKVVEFWPYGPKLVRLVS